MEIINLQNNIFLKPDYNEDKFWSVADKNIYLVLKNTPWNSTQLNNHLKSKKQY